MSCGSPSSWKTHWGFLALIKTKHSWEPKDVEIPINSHEISVNSRGSGCCWNHPPWSTSCPRQQVPGQSTAVQGWGRGLGGKAGSASDRLSDPRRYLSRPPFPPLQNGVRTCLLPRAVVRVHKTIPSSVPKSTLRRCSHYVFIKHGAHDEPETLWVLEQALVQLLFIVYQEAGLFFPYLTDEDTEAQRG